MARHLNHEAAKAVRYGGVPESEALKFVTLNPAKQLRIDDYVGSLDIGKHADLVIWSGHPVMTWNSREMRNSTRQDCGQGTTSSASGICMELTKRVITTMSECRTAPNRSGYHRI